jgi:flagellar basal body-associated protein FliL
VLTLDLRDAKLVIMLMVGVGILVLAAAYVLMLIAGNLFKHIKKEDTPFTAGNVRRLRLLGIFHIVFWACGIALSYFVGCEFIRRLGLPSSSVNLSLNLTALLLSLVYFFLARVFSFGKAQGDALQASQPAPEPVYEAPVAAPVYAAPAAVQEAEPVKPEPVFTPEPEPIPAPEAAPEAATAEAVEAPAEPEA